MKIFRALLALLFCTLAFSANAYDAPNRGIQGARTLTVSDMEQPPVSAAAFTQCNLLIAAFFTLQSGEFVKIDVAHHEGIKYDDAMRWGDTALAGAVRVEATCDDPGETMHIVDAAPALPDPAQGRTTVLRESVCGELLAVVTAGPNTLEVIRLRKKTPLEAQEIIAALKTAKAAGAPVYDIELEEGCQST